MGPAGSAPQLRFKPASWLLLSLLAVAITWAYADRVQGPWRYYQNIEIGSLKADLGDMYSPWFGTRELLERGRNPYGPEVSHEIQTAYYGRPLTQEDQQPDPSAPVVDEQRFAYPVYVVFLIAPAIHASFPAVHAWSRVLLTALTVAGIFLWLQVLHWKPPRLLAAAVVLFLLSSPQIVHGLRLCQLGLLVAFLLALAVWCAGKNYLATAGVCLAFSTIKPQMVVLALLWFMFWTIADWPRRWRLAAGFALALAVLAAAGEWILPGWLHDFWNGLMAYRRYAHRESLLEVAFGPLLGMICAAAVILGLMVLMWRFRAAAADSGPFLRMLALTLTLSTVALPLLPAFNQVVLILPALLTVRDWRDLNRNPRFLFAMSVTWPWLTSLILLFLLPHPTATGRLWLVPSYGVLFVPFILVWLLMAGNLRVPNLARALPPASIFLC